MQITSLSVHQIQVVPPWLTSRCTYNQTHRQLDQLIWTAEPAEL